MKSAWESEFLQRAPSEKDKALIALAVEYHERTEAYDRRVCTGPIRNGCIIPTDGRERALIAANAREIRHELNRRAEEIGATSAELQKAIVETAP